MVNLGDRAMQKSIISFFSVLFLSACGTIASGQNQLITIKTPNATNTKCLLHNEDFKVIAYSYETVRVPKSGKDMMIDCYAPGNRHKAVLAKRKLNGWSLYNIANGVIPGVAYDYFSKGLYEYPEILSINFAGEQSRPYDKPSYSNQKLYKGEGVYLGPTIVKTQNGHITNDLPKRTNSYNDFNVSKPVSQTVTVPKQSKPYRSNRPIVSYDPTEEDK